MLWSAPGQLDMQSAGSNEWLHMAIQLCDQCRYTTPLFSEIDKIGVIPDASCKTGQQVPPGLPFDQEQTERMLQALSHDGCIIQAEESIDALLGNPPL